KWVTFGVVTPRATPRLALALALLSLPPSVAPQTEDTAEAHLGMGYDALREDRYDAAVTEFRAALRLDSSLVMRARFPLAVAFFELKQSTEAGDGQGKS